MYETPEAKLATMKRKLKKGDYELYSDETSGEVAVRNVTTGQILFTNPYDIGASNATDSIKYQLLSQIIISTRTTARKENSTAKYASMRDQITVKNIKNGIRVGTSSDVRRQDTLSPRHREHRFRELQSTCWEYYSTDRTWTSAVRGSMTGYMPRPRPSRSAR